MKKIGYQIGQEITEYRENKGRAQRRVIALHGIGGWSEWENVVGEVPTLSELAEGGYAITRSFSAAIQIIEVGIR